MAHWFERDREIVTTNANYSAPLANASSRATAQLIRPPMASSPFQTLPDDVLQRVLAGIPLDDHQAAAATCQAFRAVISGPRFPALRQLHGCAEHDILLVGTGRLAECVSIRLAHESGVLARISGDLMVDDGSRSTTDGGARVFVSRREHSIAPNRILAIDVSSRRWRRLTTPPLDQDGYCMEWCGGRLYVAGGHTGPNAFLDSLHAFDETTGLWEDMPPMPHGCSAAASGVIGNQLFIAGGYTEFCALAFSATLQIYNTVTRAWRLAAPPPEFGPSACGVVLDGKLFVFGSECVVYDPQSDTWAEESVPWRAGFSTACAHEGRIVAFLGNGTAFARAADGTWSPYEITYGAGRYAVGSVLLG